MVGLQYRTSFVIEVIITDLLACFFIILYHLTSKRRAKGKFHYPTAGLFSASLKMKIKIFCLLEIVRNDVKKAQNAIISLLFPSYVNWQPPENRLCIAERARREVA